MEAWFKQQQGHRPLLRPGSSSLSWLEWFYSGVVCTCATTVVQLSHQHLVAAAEETKQRPRPSHQKPTPPQYSPRATQKEHDSPTRTLHFWSQDKGFICTGGLYKLLKWMLIFGWLNHILETDRTPQFLNPMNLLQEEEGNYGKAVTLSTVFA